MAPKSNKKPDPVEAARNDLAAAETRLTEIKARENEAVESAEAFAAWRRERDEAVAEVERCGKMVEQLEIALAEEAENARRAAMQKRKLDQQRASEALSHRILDEAGPAIKTLIDLARAVAADDIEVVRLNAALGEDEQIVSADMLARDRAPAPREVISEKRISLWTFASTGSIVGNQGEVIELGDGTGRIPISNGSTPCVRREFFQTEYWEAEPRQQFRAFYAALRLPNVDGPGCVWDPVDRVRPAAALEALERRAAGERAVLTEIRPYRAAEAS